MPWDYDDDEINGLIDSNIKSSPPAEPMVNKASTVRTALKQMWLAIRLQVANAVDLADSALSQSIEAKNAAQNAASAAAISKTQIDATIENIVQTVVEDAIDTVTKAPSIPPILYVDFLNTNVLPLSLNFSQGTTAYCFSKKGQLVSVKNGQPCFEYDPISGKPKGLRIEGTASNLMPTSFMDVAWSRSGVNPASETYINDLGSNMVNFFEDNTTGSHETVISRTITAGAKYFFSLIVKKKSGTRYIRLQVADGATSSNGFRALFDVNDGSRVAPVTFGAGSGVESWIEDLGNSKYRITVAGIVDSTSTNARFSVIMQNQKSIYVASYSGDGTSGVYILGANLTTIRHSYFSGSSAAATLLSLNGSSFIKKYNPTEFTVGLEVVETRYSVTENTILSISDGTSLKELTISRTSSSNMQLKLIDGGEIFAINQTIPVVENAVLRIFFGIANGVAVFSINGNAIATASGFTLPLTFSQLKVGSNLAGVNIWNGYIRAIVIYPKKLSDFAIISSGETAFLSGNVPDKTPTNSRLGSAAYLPIEDLLAMPGYSEFSVEGNGSNKTITINRPYDFLFSVVDSTSSTIVAQPPTECLANTDYLLTFNASTSRQITYSTTFKR